MMGRRKLLYVLAASVFAVFISIAIFTFIFFGTNVKTGQKSVLIYIPDGSSYEQVMKILDSNLRIRNVKVLGWVGRKKNYPALIKPGRYLIDKDLSYNALINMLRSGNQHPVRVTFSNIQTLNQLAGKIGKQIEADSSQIISFLNDESNYSTDGFSKETIIALFIPNTYEFYWNTDARGLYLRMLKEYRSFWNDERIEEAKQEGLTPVEVAILASIIDDEVAKPDEKPRIAGVYLNRLR